ncbi:patatin-like phospholipase family protein [Candidatus Jidaibacter acanthamoebae]|nr:patatin-like phospholipase family protein [Candidatus Jidaibacter acanthamoeba]
MEKKQKIVHMALQGGGAHGAFAWGVLDKILEDGRLSIDGMCATSAGSMNAVVYAYGKMKGGREGAREALHNFWYNISQSVGSLAPKFPPFFNDILKKWTFNLFDAMSHVVSPYQFNPNNINIIRDVLERTVNFEEMKSCNCTKLFISATNVRTGKVKVFDNKELSLDVVLASACLPYLFHSVKIKDEYYWDGGYIGNPAIFPLFYEGTTRDVIIIHINPIVRSKLPTEASEIMNRINEITFNASLLHEFRAIAFVNKLIEEGWIKDEYQHKLRNILMHSIRADEALHDFDISTKFDASWVSLTNLRDLGRIEAKNWLEKNFDKIGKKSSVNLKKEILENGDDHIG